jgi:acetyltransferase
LTIARARKFVAERLLQPRSVALLGSRTQGGQRVLENIRASNFSGQFWTVGTEAGTDLDALGALPEVPDLAIIASQPMQAPLDIAAAGAMGVGAVLVTSQVADLGGLAKFANLRALGPNSFGLAVPKLGLNASLSHMAVPPGHIALVTQSASLARTIVDWAGPNGVGFSHVVGIGGNEDVGFGLVLDFLSRDPDTKLILLDIRRVRDRRAFISAARAASRLRPVVALRPGGRLLDESGRSDAVFAAALTRAGVYVVQRMEAFLAAAETLSRSRALRGHSMAVVTNAISPGRLAADAALAAGIKLAILPPEAQTSLTASLPADLVYGLIYADSPAPTDVANIAAMASAVPGVGGVLAMLAPTGPQDKAAVEAIIAAAHTAPLPLLACVMGETTGAGHRRRLAEAGVPAFATPEQAVQGFSHLLRDRHARQSARELPGSSVLEVAPDHATIDRILHTARAMRRLELTAGESLDLLGAYGLRGPQRGEIAGNGVLARLSVHDDPTFGPAICLTVPPDGFSGGLAYDLPPLNLTLGQDFARRAGLTDAELIDAAASALVRVSQALIELPQIQTLEIGHLRLHAGGARASDIGVTLRPPGDLAVLAISPYPEQWVDHWSAGGQDFTIRPIRPEDAEAHAAMIARVPPEDLRYRFFTAMRQVAPEQMARLTQIDYDREMAFIAVRHADQATVGVARLVREADRGGGEYAILVQPDMKGLGLARHLMNRLIDWARFAGIPRITGQVLSDNQKMLGFVRHLGFEIRRMADEPDVVEAVLEIK